MFLNCALWLPPAARTTSRRQKNIIFDLRNWLLLLFDVYGQCAGRAAGVGHTTNTCETRNQTWLKSCITLIEHWDGLFREYFNEHSIYVAYRITYRCFILWQGGGGMSKKASPLTRLDKNTNKWNVIDNANVGSCPRSLPGNVTNRHQERQWLRVCLFVCFLFRFGVFFSSPLASIQRWLFGQCCS